MVLYSRYFFIFRGLLNYKVFCRKYPAFRVLIIVKNIITMFHIRTEIATNQNGTQTQKTFKKVSRVISRLLNGNLSKNVCTIMTN